MRTGIFYGLLLVALLPSSTRGQHADSAAADIRRVIQESYVEGVFIDRDPSVVRRGFHPQFVMSVLDDDSVIAASLDMWLGRMQLDGERSSDRIRSVIDSVDITGNAAVVKLRLWINDHHTYTDYMGLYRFPDGWKIVNKLFATHE